MSQKEEKIAKIRQWIAMSGAEDYEDPATMSDNEIEQTLKDLGLNSADLGGGRRRSRRRRGGARRRRSRRRRRGGGNWASNLNNRNQKTASGFNPIGGSRKARRSRKGGWTCYTCKGGARRSRKARRSRRRKRRGGSSAAQYMKNSPLLKAVSNSQSGSRNARKGGARRSRKARRSRRR